MWTHHTPTQTQTWWSQTPHTGAYDAAPPLYLLRSSLDCNAKQWRCVGGSCVLWSCVHLQCCCVCSRLLNLPYCWRLMADVMNDAAIFLDLLAPFFPEFFLLIMCLSSITRASLTVTTPHTTLHSHTTPTHTTPHTHTTHTTPMSWWRLPDLVCMLRCSFILCCVSSTLWAWQLAQPEQLLRNIRCSCVAVNAANSYTANNSQQSVGWSHNWSTDIPQQICSEVGGPFIPGGSIHTPGYLDQGVQIFGGSNHPPILALFARHYIVHTHISLDVWSRAARGVRSPEGRYVLTTVLNAPEEGSWGFSTLVPS